MWSSTKRGRQILLFGTIVLCCTCIAYLTINRNREPNTSARPASDFIFNSRLNSDIDELVATIVSGDLTEPIFKQISNEISSKIAEYVAEKIDDRRRDVSACNSCSTSNQQVNSTSKENYYQLKFVQHGQKCCRCIPFFD